MCGIAGIIANNLTSNIQHDIEVMTQSLIHRGPDSGGTSVIDNVALGFRRLAILDLSVAGNQPMKSPSGRYHMVFNGEIYNHKELRASINKDTPWRGHSDSETLINHIESYGLEKTLSVINGMFAIAVWDNEDKTLSLARDRLGEKPLYYGWNNSNFLFGSELRALVKHPNFIRNINYNSASLFFRYSYIPSPHTIWKNIHKLPPATFLVIDSEGNIIGKKKYWNIPNQSNHIFVTEKQQKDYSNEFAFLIEQSVKRRMDSDVPLGSFLSGGLDSSAITSIMQKHSSSAVKTFSMGFEHGITNEAPQAKKIAEYLKTEHHELYVHDKDMLEVVVSLPEIWDEPFADSSQIPTFLLSKYTRKHVSVALSGDGGDELLFGYSRYLNAQRFLKITSQTPTWIKTFTKNVISNTTNGYNRLSRIAEMLSVKSEIELYKLVVSFWNSELLTSHGESNDFFSDASNDTKYLCFEDLMMHSDANTYLPDDILVKVDRATMANSLEGRAPFLDHKLVEFCFNLPINQKYHNGQTKYILRQFLNRYIPPNLINKPKTGFSPPLSLWLKTSLKDWSENLIYNKALQSHHGLMTNAIESAWERFLKGEDYQKYRLWPVLMYLFWLEKWAI